MKIPNSHPRYESLKYRHMIIEGMREGYVADAGLIAHGRGEAFDYLLGEKSVSESLAAEKAAVALLMLSKNPVVSVNGNAAALVPKEMVGLARAIKAKLEVNLFYRTEKREKAIARVLEAAGADEVLGVGDGMESISGLESERSRADPEGIWKADSVLVPLEDGDRAEALAKAGKNVISIDLNPLSRTSQCAAVSIVDNIVRAIPNMASMAADMENLDRTVLEEVLACFDNKSNLGAVTSRMRKGL